MNERTPPSPCYFTITLPLSQNTDLILTTLGTNQIPAQSALELGLSHCPNSGKTWALGLWQICLCPGGFAFALKLPEFLNTNLVTVGAKLGQTSSFPNGPQIWFPIGQ